MEQQEIFPRQHSGGYNCAIFLLDQNTRAASRLLACILLGYSYATEPFIVTHNIFLGLGSNLGDRQVNLQSALTALPPEVDLLAQSPIYQTAPWGYTQQADFLNQVVQAQTNLSPKELLAHLKNVETLVGRTPSFQYGPRQIDIDILVYDDLCLESEELTIPHPRLHERAFMLVPLADLAENFRHPRSGQPLSEMLAGLDHAGIHKITE